MNPPLRLATGRKLDLCRAVVYELQLLPGISDALAFRIVEQQQAILRTAAELPRAGRYHALEIVHGIGRARAKKLGEFLELLCRRAPRRRQYVPLRGLDEAAQR